MAQRPSSGGRKPPIPPRPKSGGKPSSRPSSAATAKPKVVNPDLIEALKTGGLQQYGRKLEEMGLVGVAQIVKMRRAQIDELIEQLLDGTITQQECEELLSIRTRQYAKRQRTWFRKETWLKPLDMQHTSLDEQVKLAIASFGL